MYITVVVSTSLSQNQKLPEATPAPDDAANLTGMVTEIDLGDVSEEDEAEEIEAEDEEIKKKMEAEKAKKTKVRSTIHNQNLLMLALQEQVSLGLLSILLAVYLEVCTICTISSWQWHQCNLMVIVNEWLYISFAHEFIRSALGALQDRSLCACFMRVFSKMHIEVTANLNTDYWQVSGVYKVCEGLCGSTQVSRCRIIKSINFSTMSWAIYWV